MTGMTIDGSGKNLPSFEKLAPETQLPPSCTLFEKGNKNIWRIGKKKNILRIGKKNPVNVC